MMPFVPTRSSSFTAPMPRVACASARVTQLDAVERSWKFDQFRTMRTTQLRYGAGRRLEHD
eukprot:4522035-Amphidinium_carterae.1